MRNFAEQYPGVHLDVCVDDRMIDITAAGFDAGVRYEDRVPLDMVGVALTAPEDWVVVGSPDLIERVGRPSKPEDLLALPCVETRIGDNSHFDWELGNGDEMIRLPVRGPVCANETELAVGAALEGAGFAYCLPRRITDEVSMGMLDIVLPEWASQGPSFMIYYPSRRQPPPGLRQLIDIIRAREGLTPVQVGRAQPRNHIPRLFWRWRNSQRWSSGGTYGIRFQ
nr:LysR substrate-binding domain-containing protein [Sphingobium sp. Sx8-8]